MRRRAALLVVDVQVDFCPGGTLPVPRGDLVVKPLNNYMELFKSRGVPIFASRDWHPRESRHFAGNGGIWPPHCIKGTRGADFHPSLMLPEETIVISKGMETWDDAYSAMQGVTANGTPFAMLLRGMGLDRLYVGGLATDYCVKETVLEALKEGFNVTLLADAVRGVELQSGNSDRAVAEMIEAGAEMATLSSPAAVLLAEGRSLEQPGPR